MYTMQKIRKENTFIMDINPNNSYFYVIIKILYLEMKNSINSSVDVSPQDLLWDVYKEYNNVWNEENTKCIVLVIVAILTQTKYYKLKVLNAIQVKINETAYIMICIRWVLCDEERSSFWSYFIKKI